MLLTWPIADDADMAMSAHAVLALSRTRIGGPRARSFHGIVAGQLMEPGRYRSRIQAAGGAAGGTDWEVPVDSTASQAHQHAAGAWKAPAATVPEKGPLSNEPSSEHRAGCLSSGFAEGPVLMCACQVALCPLWRISRSH